jgi:hypothetical protein
VWPLSAQVHSAAGSDRAINFSAVSPRLRPLHPACRGIGGRTAASGERFPVMSIAVERACWCRQLSGLGECNVGTLSFRLDPRTPDAQPAKAALSVSQPGIRLVGMPVLLCQLRRSSACERLQWADFAQSQWSRTQTLRSGKSRYCGTHAPFGGDKIAATSFLRPALEIVCHEYNARSGSDGCGVACAKLK